MHFLILWNKTILISRFINKGGSNYVVKIFFVNNVNNVNNATTIQRLLAKDIYGEEPIKYRVSFRSKEKTPIQDFSFTEN